MSRSRLRTRLFRLLLGAAAALAVVSAKTGSADVQSWEVLAVGSAARGSLVVGTGLAYVAASLDDADELQRLVRHSFVLPRVDYRRDVLVLALDSFPVATFPDVVGLAPQPTGPPVIVLRRDVSQGFYDQTFSTGYVLVRVPRSELGSPTPRWLRSVDGTSTDPAVVGIQPPLPKWKAWPFPMTAAKLPPLPEGNCGICTRGAVDPATDAMNRREFCSARRFRPQRPFPRTRVLNSFPNNGYLPREGVGYSLQRLIPSELGGTSAAANSWLQWMPTRPGIDEKYELDAILRHRVCNYQTTLADAQLAERDWTDKVKLLVYGDPPWTSEYGPAGPGDRLVFSDAAPADEVSFGIGSFAVNTATAGFTLTADGDLRGSARTATLAEMIAAYGKPGTCTPGWNGREPPSPRRSATVSWPKVGVQARLVAHRSLDVAHVAPALRSHVCRWIQYLHPHTVSVTGAGWHTSLGLHVGDSIQTLRRLYPEATLHADGWWLETAWGGKGGYYGRIVAVPGGTRISSFRIGIHADAKP